MPWRWGTCGWLLASENHQVLLVDDMQQDARCATGQCQIVGVSDCGCQNVWVCQIKERVRVAGERSWLL